VKTNPRIVSLVLLFLVFAGCRNKENPSSTQPLSSSPAARKTATPPPAQSIPAQTPLNYESDPLYRQAQGLFHADVRGSIGLLEAAIAKAPDNPNSAPYYLLLGRVKKEFENCQGDYANSSLSEPAKQCKGFMEYAEARPNEYFYNEVGGDYLYGGFHFHELEKRFPSSPLAVEAAYEMISLSQGGECEGFLDCYIASAFTPVRNFLDRYPDTPHTAEAVRRADDAFRKTLWGDVWKTEWVEIKDPNNSSDYYDPANLKKMVQEYEDLAEKLPVRARASAWETVAYYRNKFGEKDRARALYARILKENPDYENLPEIRKLLAALP
jgi:tetratricopeptide (TPR) repeat protein